MIVLGIETATAQVGCALGGDEGSLASFHSSRPRRHAETLAPAIDFVARQAGVGLDQLGGVAVDVGPGLFTGLRVGVMTAKVLAEALGIPVIGRSSLELLAHPHGHWRGVIASVVDARRGEVFWALYQGVPGPVAADSTVTVERVSDHAVSRPADLVSALAARQDEILAVGDGAIRYAEQLRAVSGLVLAGPGAAHPSARVLVELSRAPLQAGESIEPAGLSPLYLRQADVRINWDQRDGTHRLVVREAG